MKKAPRKGRFSDVSGVVRNLGSFQYFAVTNTGSADFHPLDPTLYRGPNALEIHIPTALRHVVGVADTISKLGPAPA